MDEKIQEELLKINLEESYQAEIDNIVYSIFDKQGGECTYEEFERKNQLMDQMISKVRKKYGE